jgi:esterase/lipase superfamily enzyme
VCNLSVFETITVADGCLGSAVIKHTLEEDVDEAVIFLQLLILVPIEQCWGDVVTFCGGYSGWSAAEIVRTRAYKLSQLLDVSGVYSKRQKIGSHNDGGRYQQNPANAMPSKQASFCILIWLRQDQK